MRRIYAVMFVLALVVFAGCGSDSSSGGSNPNASGDATPETAAVSTACAGGANAATSEGTEALGGNTDTSVNVRVARAIAEKARVALEKDMKAGTGKVTYRESDNSVTYIFDSATDVFEVAGGGTVALDGSITGTANTDNDNQITITITGPVTVTLDSVADSVTIDGTTYNEVISGSITITFDGTLVVEYTDEGVTSVDIDFTATSTGSDITVTGTISGTVSDLNVTSNVSGDALETNGLTLTCGGSVTAVTSGGTETCNISSDCTGCL